MERQFLHSLCCHFVWSQISCSGNAKPPVDSFKRYVSWNSFMTVLLVLSHLTNIPKHGPRCIMRYAKRINVWYSPSYYNLPKQGALASTGVCFDRYGHTWGEFTWRHHPLSGNLTITILSVFIAGWMWKTQTEILHGERMLSWQWRLSWQHLCFCNSFPGLGGGEITRESRSLHWLTVEAAK